ncbi:MAG: hypothetical protein IJV00_00235 [Clostridia bacterium]|nr:hypothetical protein [Clostridia bacterium]
MQTSIKNDEKLLELIESGQCAFILSRIAQGGSFCDSSKKTLSGIIFDSRALKKRIAHKNRLFEKYTLRIKAASELIQSPTSRNFVICRYLYGFNAEKIAEINYYSERHIYRLAQTANRRLFLALLKVMPRRAPREISKTYRVTAGKLSGARRRPKLTVPRLPAALRRA